MLIAVYKNFNCGENLMPVTPRRGLASRRDNIRGEHVRVAQASNQRLIVHCLDRIGIGHDLN